VDANSDAQYGTRYKFGWRRQLNDNPGGTWSYSRFIDGLSQQHLLPKAPILTFITHPNTQLFSHTMGLR
jgi:hypothetical protein